jgi:hypothetical protein
MSRARLMKGQALIASAMGIFQSSGGNNPYGDVYGDIYGDPTDVAEVALTDTVKPLMGTPLPLALFGGLAKLLGLGQSSSETKLNSMITSAGASQDPASKGNVSDPAMKAAMERVLTNSGSITNSLDGPNVSLNTLSSAIELVKAARASGQSGDAMQQVHEQYGDVVADNWRRGNVPGMMSGIVDLAGDAMATTGDTELDHAIITDVLESGDVLYGDAESSLDKEVGGLFTRARINHAIRKGRKRQRKMTTKSAKAARKDALSKKLAEAKAFEQDQFMDETSQPLDNQSMNDVIDNPDFSTDGTAIPDDQYGLENLII